MKKDLYLTMFTQLIALVSLVITFKLVSFYFGSIAFSEYSVTRRSLSLAVIVISLGIHISLIKYISYYHSNIKKKINILLSAFLIFIVMYFLLGILVYLYLGYISFVLYADYNHYKLSIALYIAIGGSFFHTLIYSYFRGNLLIKYANSIDIINNAIIPIIIIFIANNINSLFILMGVFQISVSLVLLLFILYKNKDIFNLKYIKVYIQKILSYGIVRLPGEIGLILFFTFFMLLINHKFGLIAGGYISFGITIVTTMAYMFSPVGTVFFPRISKMLANKKYIELKQLIIKTIIIIFVISMFQVSIFFLLKKELLYLFVPSMTNLYINTIGYLVLGSFLYPLYLVLKNIIDALYSKGINSINLFKSFLIVSILAISVIFFKENTIFIYIVLFNIFVSLITILSLYSIYKYIGGLK